MHLTFQSVYPAMIIIFFCIKKLKDYRIPAAEAPLAVHSRHSFLAVCFWPFNLQRHSPFLYGYLILGILGGWLLVFFAKKNISFEKRRGKIYFRTHIWVEMILLTLFLSRFLYRVTELYLTSPDLNRLGSYSQSIGTDL